MKDMSLVTISKLLNLVLEAEERINEIEDALNKGPNNDLARKSIKKWREKSKEIAERSE